MVDYVRWMVSYYDAATNEYLWQDEEVPPRLAVGDGVLLPIADYRRFRVEDVWHSYDSHGDLDRGTHVFLRDVSNSEEDRAKQKNPGYYTS
ncbi:hypothetical protein [Nocardioides deserti]|uniref:Uncharacterized protein n=1 Tax=Nocardioides deserti TaxID=1588644 RepID=A0ABR6UA61_9ACTN|nr:hypothetical protein [Nocardioides deserti]MBC2961334.1 hypothetical protein [Nocardioides deserti]GGO72444.1 hypothetical protein GCM10012276_15820 [Nocardioides deserti]